MSKLSNAVFFFSVFFLIVDSSVLGKNAVRRTRQRQSFDDEDSLPNSLSNEGGSDLIALVEDGLQLNGLVNEQSEDGDRKVLKRNPRSPLDDDLDEEHDSEEDDEEEGGNEKKPKIDGVNEKKDESTNTPPSPSTGSAPPKGTTVSSSSQISKPSLSLPSTTASSRGNAVLAPTTSNSGPTNGSKAVSPPTNGSTRSLPPGFKPPPGAIIGKIPGGISFPPGGIPGRPGSGKLPPLPPDLLKKLAAPKPPAKKGELTLPDDYNNLVIPKLNLGKLIGIESYTAVPVLVFLNIRSVRDIDETMETLTLDLDLVIEWVDGFLFDPITASRARQPDITLNPIFLKKIWRPDIYIDEIVKVKRQSLMNKPLKLKFNPSNGFISYTTRLTVQLNCDMIYTYYPADTHRCEFTFRSYSYFSGDMQLSWLGTGVYLQDPYDPNFDLQVESTDHVKLPQTFRKLTNDTYDALTFTILARRKISYHVAQTYLPSIFFIVITWLCFLVPARMVEARIGISMTTLLTLTSMFSSVRESTPIVSYVKAIDIWMVCCIFFVFLTLLEFSALVWLRSRREDAEEQKLINQRKVQGLKGQEKKDVEATFNRSPSLESIHLRKYDKFAEATEKYAFFIFSTVFLIFNVIYWTWLLVNSEYTNWNVNSTLNADLNDE